MHGMQPPSLDLTDSLNGLVMFVLFAAGANRAEHFGFFTEPDV